MTRYLWLTASIVAPESCPACDPARFHGPVPVDQLLVRGCHE